MKRVSVDSDAVTTICALPSSVFLGGSWSPDGESIAFSSGSYSLYVVPARGGTAELAVADDPEVEGRAGTLARPHFLPSEAGSRVLLYTYGGAPERKLVVHDLESGRRSLLGPGTHPSYAGSGHIVFQEDLTADRLWALPFSLDKLESTGEAFPVARSARGATVAVDHVYLDGVTEMRQLIWVDREGTKTGQIGDPQPYVYDPRLSPDEKFLAVSADSDIWVLDVDRGVRRRITALNGVERHPRWDPTGRTIAYSFDGAGGIDVATQPVDSGGAAETIVDEHSQNHVLEWSTDGKYILYNSTSIDGLMAEELKYLELADKGNGWEARTMLRAPFNLWWAALSPDARFVAYVSNETGREEVYIRSFPDGKQTLAVSRDGGIEPRWSGDGSELFYVQGFALMAVPVSTEPSLSVGSATSLFEHPGLESGLQDPQYDVSADSQRFVLAEPTAERNEGPPSIRVVQNWYEEFRDRQ